MKRILLCLTFIIITHVSTNAQICNTLSPEPPSWLFNSALQSAQSISTTYTLCVFVHIVRSSSGNGLGTGIVSNLVSKLNSDYANTGIQFQSIGNDFINSDVFYSSLVSSEYAELYATNSHINAIDIYVLGTSTNTGNTLGVAASIPSTALWVHGNYYNTSVLSHEMGHCLGLYHTHHGTITESGGDLLQCKELVNGSNSSICGDYVTDTPADPNFWNGCNYNGTVKDDNNQSYNPNPSNYMSYSSYTCWSLFTTVQKQRMKDFIANTMMLQNVILPATPTISGPDYVCSNSSSTFTVNNLPSNTSVSWTVSSGLQIVSSTGNSVLVKKNNFNDTDFSQWVEASFLTFALHKNVTVWRSGIQNYSINQAVLYGNLFNTGGECWLYNPLLGIPLEGSDFTWSMNVCDWTASNQGYYFTFFDGTDCCGSQAYITVNFTDVCGGNSTIYKSFYTDECLLSYSAAYPNPAGNELIIDKETDSNEITTNTIESSQNTKAKNTATVKVLLYSHSTTKLVYSKDFSASAQQIKIDTSTLPNGIYYLNIIANGEKIKQQTIIVNH
ncbi:MAG: hypothetical protein LBP85_02570 [Prevotellaceae bacterium]|jgi:hypothetical protein|nr:hypothetical protein [Prevotellaceae bacterium]